MDTAGFHSPIFRGGVIIADAGYRVVLFERFRLRYEEDDLSLIFSYESIPGYMDIFHGSVCDSLSEQPAKLGPEMDRRVCDNLQKALEWKGFEVHFVT